MKAITARSCLLVAASAAALGVSSNVFAQTPVSGGDAKSPPADRSTAAPDAGDIVVTAQRVDSSLSKTPVAVTVVSSDTLAKAQVVSEQDLRATVPGLSIRAGLSSNQLNYSLRGQSQDAYSGTRPGVLPYINEVQIGGGGGSTAFYDLASVQVLKGPQGTLFGRSATGGAVLFTTQKPQSDFGGYISGTYGNYNAAKLEGAINVPLIKDTLLARVAGFYQRRDGFQYNTYTNSTTGGQSRFGFRGSLTANLGNIKNEFVIDYLKSDGSNTAAVISGLEPLGPPGSPPYVPASLLYGGTSTPVATATGIAVLQAFTGYNLATATAQYNSYFSNPQHPAVGLAGFLAIQNARGPYTISINSNNDYKGENVIITNATSFSIGPNTTLKNIFGYTHLVNNSGTDADSTPFGIAGDLRPTGGDDNLGNLSVTRQISDEIQISGKTLADKLDYVTGFYFSDEKNDDAQINYDFDILSTPIPPPTHYNFSIKNRTYAGYGQVTYHINSTLAGTGGLRYTSERVGKRILPGDVNYLADCVGSVPGFSCNKSATYDRLSWTAGLQDQINRSTLVYVASRRAYKSGGYNGTTSPKDGSAIVAGDSYLDERITDAELGAKFFGHAGSMPVRASVALYYDWIKNSQRVAFGLVNGAPAALTTNVPKGETYGLEFEAQFKPADWLSLGGTFNYTHATFSPDPVAVNGSSSIYDQVPDTPKTSGNIYAEVSRPLSKNIVGTLHGDVYAQSRSFDSPRSINNEGTVIKSYVLANFRVGIEDPTAGWSLTANLKNAFNRVYYVGGLPLGEIFQINTAVPGDPRTFTIEARFKF